MPEFKPEANYTPIPESPSNIVPSENGSIMNRGTTQSPNFIPEKSGWKLNSDGSVEINGSFPLKAALEMGQANLTITNFKKWITEPNSDITIWISDGTTPNGNLTGVKGDICLNSSATGQIAYCTADGTTWTLL